jgi:hypothetical protein
MCNPSTAQYRSEPRAPAPWHRLWLLLAGGAPAESLKRIQLGQLSPHMRRDIGLDPQPAAHWSDGAALLSRDEPPALTP